MNRKSERKDILEKLSWDGFQSISGWFRSLNVGGQLREVCGLSRGGSGRDRITNNVSSSAVIECHNLIFSLTLVIIEVKKLKVFTAKNCRNQRLNRAVTSDNLAMVLKRTCGLFWLTSIK